MDKDFAMRLLKRKRQPRFAVAFSFFSYLSDIVYRTQIFISLTKFFRNIV